MKPGYKESLLHHKGIIISPQPTKYNNGLKIKVTDKGREVKGKDRIYTATECYAQIEIITDFYYERLNKEI